MLLLCHCHKSKFHHHSSICPSFPPQLSQFPQAAPAPTGVWLRVWSALLVTLPALQKVHGTQPLKSPAFSQLLARDCRRGRGLPPRLRGHLLEVGSSAKCPDVVTPPETAAASESRKQVAEGYLSTIPPHRLQCLSIWLLHHDYSLCCCQAGLSSTPLQLSLCIIYI